MRASEMPTRHVIIPKGESAVIPDGWVVIGGWKLFGSREAPDALNLVIRKESEGEIARLNAEISSLRQRHRQQLDMNQELSARLDYALEECDKYAEEAFRARRSLENIISGEPDNVEEKKSCTCFSFSDDECGCNDPDTDPLEDLLARVAIIEKFLWGSSNG